MHNRGIFAPPICEFWKDWYGEYDTSIEANALEEYRNSEKKAIADALYYYSSIAKDTRTNQVKLIRAFNACMRHHEEVWKVLTLLPEGLCYAILHSFGILGKGWCNPDAHKLNFTDYREQFLLILQELKATFKEVDESGKAETNDTESTKE